MEQDRMKALIVLVGLLLLGPAAPTGAVEVPRNHFYPQEAFLVPLTQRDDLQVLLDLHGVIRLATGDYGTRSNLAKLVIRSGNRIYGLGNNMPTMEIEPGTTGAVLSAVHGNLVFPPSELVTSYNVFRHVTYSTITVDGGTLENNLFLDNSFSQWVVDHSASGHWSGNRLVRLYAHSVSPLLSIRGRAAARPDCRGNVLLWMNSLGASTDIVRVADQRDLNLVYIDCESYDTGNHTAMTFRNIDDLSIFATTGRMTTGRAIDQGASSMWLHGHLMSTSIGPNTVQRASNAGSVITYFNPDLGTPSNEGSGSRLRLLDTSNDPTKVMLLNEAPLITPLGAVPEYALMNALAKPRNDPTWERPSFDPIPDPAGPNWNSGLASQSSSRALIQQDIEANGIAVLGPGIYYLDGPLVLANNQGLVGAGADRTALIALNSGIDLITSRRTNPSAPTEAVAILLADVTLQGGRCGIHHTTSGAQFSGMTISHVTIRDMADSGIAIENCYAWDNNWIDFLNITRCPVGFRQHAPSGSFAGHEPWLSYMDKNVFYQCQISACERAIDFAANRPSNGNMWINSRFADHTTQAIRMSSHYSTVFTNCVFSNNNGHPTVLVRDHLFFVGCAFEDSTSGATDFVASMDLHLEGCTFSRAGGSSVVITADTPDLVDLGNPTNHTHYHNRNTFFFNCRSDTVPLNQLYAGMVVNSHFFDRPDLSVQAAVIRNAGTIVTTLVPGTVDPSTVRSQLLVGAVLPGGMVSETLDAPPVLTSPTAVDDATAGTPFAYAITADHFPTAYAASGLPAWLTLHVATGILSGTPPLAGTVTFAVTASNIVGADTQTVTLTVAAAAPNAPVISSAVTVTGFLETPFSFQIVALPAAISYAATALPPGLAINATSGLITGTPSQLGTTVAAISAANANGSSTTSVVFVVQPKVVTRPVPPGMASDGGEGGSGCGFGATAAALLLAAMAFRLRRQRLEL